MSRNEYFAGLFLLGCANGLVARGAGAVHRMGWMESVYETFGLSVIVLIACGAGLWLTARGRQAAVKPADLAVGAVALVLIALPLGGTSWLAVSGLAAYVLLLTEPDPSMRRGATILLAATVPMLWSSLLFQYFANFILAIDASLVSSLLGTYRTGNMVRFASDEGYLVILPACSSLANMSLALLSWVTMSELVEHRRSLDDLRWCGLACLSVVAINVGRMSLMGIDLDHYEALHSSVGDAAATAVIPAATF